MSSPVETEGSLCSKLFPGGRGHRGVGGVGVRTRSCAIHRAHAGEVDALISRVSTTSVGAVSHNRGECRTSSISSCANSDSARKPRAAVPDKARRHTGRRRCKRTRLLCLGLTLLRPRQLPLVRELPNLEDDRRLGFLDARDRCHSVTKEIEQMLVRVEEAFHDEVVGPR